MHQILRILFSGDTSGNLSGVFPNLFRAQALLPRLVGVETGLLQAILVRQGALLREQRERVLLVVAAAYGNRYCLTAHYQALRSRGASESQLDQILTDPHHAGLREPDQALLDFAFVLSRRPESFRRDEVDGLRQHGFTDEQVLEAVLTTALGRLLCLLAGGLGAEPEFAPQPGPRRAAPFLPRLGRAHAHSSPGPYLRADELDAETFWPFVYCREQFGVVPNLFRAQTLRPDVLEAEAEAVRTVLLTTDHLSRLAKERVFLVVSASNLSTYCVAVHCEILRGLGVSPEQSDQIAADHHQTNLPPAEKALLDFARKLNERPEEIVAADRDRLRSHGFSEEEILEAIAQVAHTCFFNTLSIGLGAKPDFPPRRVFLFHEASLYPGAAAPAAPPEDPDAGLVARVRAGEVETFEELVRRHHRRIYHMLVGMLGDPDESRDAVQETFLKAFEHLGEFQGRSRFATWLARIAHNMGIERLRRREILESLDDGPGEGEERFAPRLVQAWQEDPEQLYVGAEIRALVEREVMKLPTKYRVVIILRDIEQLSSEEAAAALGLSIPGLKARLLRGRLMLREALSPHFTGTKIRSARV
jgi:RNA polymerase sigma-70 factor (ECF subfamily)